jgi:hypothetical protein
MIKQMYHCYDMVKQTLKCMRLWFVVIKLPHIAGAWLEILAFGVGVR